MPLKKYFYQLFVISLLTILFLYYLHTTKLNPLEKIKSSQNLLLVDEKQLVAKIVSALNLKALPELSSNSITSHSNSNIPNDKHNYLKKYHQIQDCTIPYEHVTQPGFLYNYSASVNETLFKERFARAVLFYFPVNSFDNFLIEFRWVYRSWVEMQKYEPAYWRTDLIVFLDDTKKEFVSRAFTELGCSFDNQRTSKHEKPKCVLMRHIALAERNTALPSKDSKKYEKLLSEVNIFDDSEENLKLFYANLKDLKHYGYLDSILMAFDGYKYLKGPYDFLVRSDMDIFLTPLFGKWLPKACNDFVVGGGGFSGEFNMKRLSRIAKDLDLGFGGEWNLGSTWYSTPHQFRLVSYLTLVSMLYISNEEFSQTERDGKLGTIHWPDWHYGVLLLYGQSVALNHLIHSNQIQIRKLAQHFDYPSGDETSVFLRVHIHVFHGDNIFSKFVFKMGKYDTMTVNESDISKVKYYALKMALDSKRLNSHELKKLANDEALKKK